MANIGVSAIKLIDSDGDALDNGDGKLKVVLSASDNIEIGNVDIKLNGTGVSAGSDTMDNGTIRVALATDDTQFGAIGAGADVDGNIHGQLRYIGESTIQAAGNLVSIDSDTSTIAGDTTELAGYFMQSGTGYNQVKGIVSLAVRNDGLERVHSGIADGDYSELQVNSVGGLYVTGSEIENAAVQSEPLLIGGRYDSSARTLGDGDAGAVALNASGHVLIDVVNGGQLDTIIDTLETTLTAIETDQAAIEVLLTAANVDHAANESLLTAIETTLTNVESAVSGNEMQVDVVAALPAGTNAIGTVGHDITAMTSSKNTSVGTSIEDLHLSNIVCKRIDMMASPSNTGYIWVGGANTAEGSGIRLAPGDFYSVDCNNTDDIQVVATVNNEDISYTIFT